MANTKSKVTSKRQVTIPKAICDRLGLRPGDVIEWVGDGRGVRVNKVVESDPFGRWRDRFNDLEGQDVDALIEDWRGN